MAGRTACREKRPRSAHCQQRANDLLYHGVQDRTPPKLSEPGTSDHRTAFPSTGYKFHDDAIHPSLEGATARVMSIARPDLATVQQSHHGQEPGILPRVGYESHDWHDSGRRAVLTSGVEEGVRDHPHEVLDEGDELPRGLRPRGDHDLGGLRDDRQPRGSTIQRTTRQRSTARTETCHAQQKTEAFRHEPSIGSVLSRKPSSP